MNDRPSWAPHLPGRQFPHLQVGGGNAVIPGMVVGEWNRKDRDILAPIGVRFRAADSGRVCGSGPGLSPGTSTHPSPGCPFYSGTALIHLQGSLL